MLHYEILAPIMLLGLGIAGYLWMRRESRKLDRRFGPDPK